MTAEVALWLGLLVASVLLFALVVQRMMRLARRTRDLERFQRAVEGIDRRFAAAVAPLVRSLDDTRRHAGNPDTLREQASEAEQVLAELAGEARGLAAPAGLAVAAAALAGDLERAIRATSLVDHGLGALAGTSIGRDLEAQTALKRGALNLKHAQAAYARRAQEVGRLRPRDLAAGSSLPPALTAGPATAWADDEA